MKLREIQWTKDENSHIHTYVPCLRALAFETEFFGKFARSWTFNESRRIFKTTSKFDEEFQKALAIIILANC